MTHKTIEIARKSKMNEYGWATDSEIIILSFAKLKNIFRAKMVTFLCNDYGEILPKATEVKEDFKSFEEAKDWLDAQLVFLNL